jgi:hypothetical protein
VIMYEDENVNDDWINTIGMVRKMAEKHRTL